jgi:hypothetical protein
MGSGLRVAQRCRSAQAGDVADLTRAGESGAHAVLLGSSCRSRSHGWIPMVIDGKSTTGEEFACRIRPAAGPDWDSLRARSQRKNSLPSAGGAVRGLPSCPSLSGFGSVSSFQPIRTPQGGAASEHVGLNQHGQGGAAVHPVSVVFRQHQCACPTDANSFRLSAFYLRPT